jgi:ribonuclease Z
LIFQVKILGNNSAVPAHNRNQTSQLMQLDSQYILIDCGEGTQIQLSKMNVRLGRIKTVLISHLHGDHYFGLVGLISTMHLYRRNGKLTVFGPPKLKEIIEMQLSASETELCFDLDFILLTHEGKLTIVEEEQFSIEAFPLNHGIGCYGFLIKEKPKQWRIIKERLPEGILIQEILKLKSGQDVIGDDGTVKYKLLEYTMPPRPARSYAYCSDTKYDERIISHIQGVDLLYHEATFAEDMKDRARLTNHSTASDAARIANLANVKKLLLGHYSTRYSDLAPLLLEARQVFAESYLSQEGETISLKE